MLELECCLASSNHVVKCSKVSRLQRIKHKIVVNDVLEQLTLKNLMQCQLLEFNILG